MDITYREVLRETVELGRGASQDGIGPGARFVGCEIRIMGSGFIACDAEFIDCRISNKRVRNRFVNNFHFVNCAFEGAFIGWVFGRDEESSIDCVEGCDFRRATMHFCRFHHIDVREQLWRGWPEVVVHDVADHVDDWVGLVLPEGLRTSQSLVAAYCRQYPRRTAHVTDVLRLVAAEEAQEARKTLASRPYVLL